MSERKVAIYEVMSLTDAESNQPLNSTVDGTWTTACARSIPQRKGTWANSASPGDHGPELAGTLWVVLVGERNNIC